MLKLHDCPECGHKLVWMNRTFYGSYFAECSRCHYIGRTRFLRILAAMSWNKEAKKKWRSNPMRK